MKTGFSKSISTLSAFTVFSLLMILSCSHEDQIVPERYKWVESALTPTDRSFIVLKVGPDGSLYAMEWRLEKSVFAKFKNGAWETMAYGDADASNFTILNDTVYYATKTGIRRARNDFDEQILETTYYGYLETYRDKVFIVGSQLNYDGAEYSLIAYDGHSFLPIDQEVDPALGNYSKRSDGKLFISGNPVKVYDGTNLTAIDFSGIFANVDPEGAVYDIVNANDSVVVINKMANGKLQSVGKNIKTKAIITRMEFAHNTVFLKGKDPDSQVTTAFYLDQNDEWRTITTPYAIFFLINFEGELYATTTDGKIIQLVLRE